MDKTKPTSTNEIFSLGCSLVQQKRSDSESSCVSLKSDRSMGQPIMFKNRDTWSDASSVQQKRSDPKSSCVSMKSGRSMGQPIMFKNNDTRSDQRPIVTEPVNRKFKHQPQDFNEDMFPHFSHESAFSEVQNTFETNLRKKFECLCEGTSKQGNPTLLNEIYTELYITEGESGEISNEHEVRQIETQSRRTATEDTPIKCNDIFKPLPAQDKHIRTVLTKGVAGIGKTVSVQKFILDWAEGKANQDIHLIFPLPFREINLIKNQISLLDLLHLFYPETKTMEISIYECKVLFIFDGLDECRLSLDFHSSVRLCDVSELASVDMILTNLIAGNLLPSALIWITSRPAAADLVPSECVDRVTEVRGFTDPQKEEYFRKRISDESLANKIISHLKSSRSLYIMCHIPVFCWISATVLERMLSEAESGEIPRTLTQIYMHFLIIQTDIKHQKDYEKNVRDEDMIFKLGKLAFEQLLKGNLIFYDGDLRECGIDVNEASVYSGLCTQIFREEFGLYQGKVYCFVHLSIQEHLAALYAHISFTNDSINVFPQSCSGRFNKILDKVKHKSSEQVLLSELHQRAVDEALQSKNGHLDLFLRFLLGLSLEYCETLLQDLQTQMRRCSYKKEKTVKYIKKKISENPSPEKSINLFHCLNELGENSLLQEVRRYVKSGSLGNSKFSSSQWAALVFVLLMCEQHLDEFDLNKFIGAQNTADEVIVKLLPVVKESKKVLLSGCSITDEGCAALASALRSNPSNLRDLDLSENEKVGDSGVKLLSAGLENPHCKLMSLRLEHCSITDEGCAALASALRSNPSHLTHLDLTNNFIQDSGVKRLSTVLENPHCKLEKLRLSGCSITDEGCVALTSALRSNPSHLTHLDLSSNKLEDSGVQLLSLVLENPYCKLEKLKLRHCSVKGKGCAALTSALRSNHSHLTHLDLSWNNVGDSGVKLLSTVLENPQCKLEKLNLNSCYFGEEGCAVLASALRSNPSHLTHLDLHWNNLGDSGVKLISAVLENPQCKLEKLKLSYCDIKKEGCTALASALKSNPSHLTNLDLTKNNVGDSGVKRLSTVLENPQCKLRKLKLGYCNLTDEGCAVLTSSLRSNPSHMRDLDLSSNELGDLGVKLLSSVLENPYCKLKKLKLSGCSITDEGCAALTSALRSNPSHLTHLDLTENKLENSGVKLLSTVLENLHCKLQKLSLRSCSITDEGCVDLASALRSNVSHLIDLDLSSNNVGDSGVKALSTVLKNPQWKLRKLSLRSCGITDEACADLETARRSNPLRLTHLDL